MVGPYLNQVGGNVDDDVSMFSEGLNTYVDKGFLEANQMPYVVNMKLGNPPGIVTRPSRLTIANWLTGNSWFSRLGSIVDLFAYDEKHIFVISGDYGNKKLSDLFQETWRTDYSQRTITPISEEDCYYFTVARKQTNSYLYITGNTFKARITIDENDPGVSNYLNIQDGNYGICCFHKGRLFLADPNSNTIKFSALYDFENFDKPFDPSKYYQVINAAPSGNDYDQNTIYLVVASDTEYNKYVYDTTQQDWVQDGTMSRGIFVSGGDKGYVLPDYSIIAGEFLVTNAIGKIVALKSFDDKLVIFCEHSMHVMYGTTPDVSSQNQFQLVDLNNNLGAISDRCIAIGGGRLFWLGDNNEVYEYSGASINMISRPGKTRNSTLSLGAVSGVLEAKDWWDGQHVDFGNSFSKFACTSEKLYINAWNKKRSDMENQKLLFVFDIYNRTWWCEDGEFNTIERLANHKDQILIGLENGDILINNKVKETSFDVDRTDEVYDFEKNEIVPKDIEYEFHTRVYGADGADLRENLSKVWVQGYANAEVFVNDIWLSRDMWSSPTEVHSNLVKIGELSRKNMQPVQDTRYRETDYEQQVCYTPKMYGQRVNTFQIVVKGKGQSNFYIMKRMWRAR